MFSLSLMLYPRAGHSHKQENYIIISLFSSLENTFFFLLLKKKSIIPASSVSLIKSREPSKKGDEQQLETMGTVNAGYKAVLLSWLT